jgi:hypothetical protein
VEEFPVMTKFMLGLWEWVAEVTGVEVVKITEVIYRMEGGGTER